MTVQELGDKLQNIAHSGKSLSRVYILNGNKYKEIFESVKDACKKYNLHHSNIVACCNRRRKTACGYKWEYVK